MLRSFFPKPIYFVNVADSGVHHADSSMEDGPTEDGSRDSWILSSPRSLVLLQKAFQLYRTQETEIIHPSPPPKHLRRVWEHLCMFDRPGVLCHSTWGMFSDLSDTVCDQGCVQIRLHIPSQLSLHCCWFTHNSRLTVINKKVRWPLPCWGWLSAYSYSQASWQFINEFPFPCLGFLLLLLFCYLCKGCWNTVLLPR